MSKQKKVKHQYKAFVTLYSGLVSSIVTEALILEPFADSTLEKTAKHVKVITTWDTGSTNTCVKQSIIDKLELKPIGVKSIHTASGETEVNTYLINILLPMKVGLQGVEVSGLPYLANTDCLLGMDIISKGDFSITNFEGRSCITFRIPSIERTDYVYEYSKQMFDGVKPYQPCPCKAKDSQGKPILFRNCHYDSYHPIRDGDNAKLFNDQE